MGAIRWLNSDPAGYFTRRWRAGERNMTSDVQWLEKINALVRMGARKKRGRLAATREGAAVTFGSPRVRYAFIRHEVNHLHPQTRKYLARAADSVGRGNIAKYFM